MNSPNPSGAKFTTLYGVACPTSASCFAVGQDQDRNYMLHALVEHWNGHRWSIMPSPTATDGLNAVTCPNAEDCIAVGSALAKP